MSFFLRGSPVRQPYVGQTHVFYSIVKQEWLFILSENRFPGLRCRFLKALQ